MRTPTILLSLTAALLLAGCSSGNVFELTVGDCFDEPADGGGEISDVPIVDCAEPHDNEVFHTFDLADGEFPGDAAVAAQVEEVCFPAFEEYVGIDYESSRLSIHVIAPTPDTWQDGDREVVCSLDDLDGAELTGSMQGSGE